MIIPTKYLQTVLSESPNLTPKWSLRTCFFDTLTDAALHIVVSATSNGKYSSLNSTSGGHCNDTGKNVSMKFEVYVCNNTGQVEGKSIRVSTSTKTSNSPGYRGSEKLEY